MIMPPGVRKLVLTVHIATSVALLGAVACFLVLAVTGLASQDAQTVRAAYLAMDVIAWLVIVPLTFISLLIGIMQSLASPWGLLQHYRVLAKLLLTVLVTVVLLLQMKTIGTMARMAAEMTLSDSDPGRARLSLVVHAAGGLLVLLVPVALSVYKPRGRTPHGRRRLRQQRAVPQGRKPAS